MGEDKREDNFNRDRAELFEALGHPIRLEIIDALSEKPMSFSALKKEVQIESSGHLSFHLEKLSGLVGATPDGLYKLTDEGRAALRLVKAAKVSRGTFARAWEGRKTSRRLLWLTFAVYGALTVFAWLDYFLGMTGYITLQGALIGTIVTPPVIFLAFKVREIRNLRFWRLVWVVFGAAAFGFVIFGVVNLLLYRLLALPFWVQMDALVREALTMPASYLIGGYLGYWLGKRRDFVPMLLDYF